MQNPNERPEPNGYAVLLKNGHDAVEHKEWFWGNEALEDAEKYAQATLDDYENMDNGVYSLSVHDAWKGSETEPHEHNPDHGGNTRVTFRVNKRAFLEVLNDR